MLIGLTGRATAGKDTVYERARGMERELGQTVKRVSFADPLYASAAAALNVTPELLRELKTDPHAYVLVTDGGGVYAELTIREYLQRYGTEAHRDVFGPDFWVEQAGLHDHEGRIVIVTDVRFKNEAQAVVAAGGYVVRVVGPPEVEGVADAHASEAGIPERLVDFVLANRVRDDGFHTLDKQVEALLRGILGREAA